MLTLRSSEYFITHYSVTDNRKTLKVNTLDWNINPSLVSSRLSKLSLERNPNVLPALHSTLLWKTTAKRSLAFIKQILWNSVTVSFVELVQKSEGQSTLTSSLTIWLSTMLPCKLWVDPNSLMFWLYRICMGVFCLMLVLVWWEDQALFLLPMLGGNLLYLSLDVVMLGWTVSVSHFIVANQQLLAKVRRIQLDWFSLLVWCFVISVWITMPIDFQQRHTMS